MTAYTPNHSASEISGLVIDGVVEAGIVAVSLVGIIALIALYVWVRRTFRW